MAPTDGSDQQQNMGVERQASRESPKMERQTSRESAKEMSVRAAWEALRAEAGKPADASDIDNSDGKAAIEEIKRLRKILKQATAKPYTTWSRQVSINSVESFGDESFGDDDDPPVRTATTASLLPRRSSLFIEPRRALDQAHGERRRSFFNVMSPPARVQRRSTEMQTVCLQAFHSFAVQREGKITLDELKNIMQTSDLNPTEDKFNSLIEEVGAKERGTFDLSQFMSFIRLYTDRVKSESMDALVTSRAKKNMVLFDVNPTGEAMEMAKCEKCAIHKDGSADIEELPMKTSFLMEDGFQHQQLFEHSVHVDVPYELQEDLQAGLDIETLDGKNTGQKVLHVQPWVLRKIAERAITHIQHYLRPGHLAQLSSILKDPEASDNDRYVAESLLRNAAIAAKGVLPGCQDTGTAICLGKKGQFCWTEDDELHLSHGIFDAYTKTNLRYSQVSPVSMFAEKNTGCNLPAQFDIYSTSGNEYKFMFMAKGGGSANKTYLFQQTKALLNPKSLETFIKEKVVTLGTSACPPYHLAIVIGGLSAEMNLKTVKLASARYLDDLPQTGNGRGRAYRDTTWEQKILALCQGFGIGAQFGGKYFVHDVRVVRLPRHGASCPVGIGVSCSADRQILVKITPDGVFLEKLEKDPSRFLPPELPRAGPTDSVVRISLDQPMANILQTLTQYPIKTRLSLSGTIIVARDIAHAKLAERLEVEGVLPDYMSTHVVYYAGPAKTPEGYASGSFGPTTAGRMDTYVPLFMQHGCSMLTLAKGNRSKAVTDACKEYGGFYLGSIGGAAANLAEHTIKKVELVEYEELGMEAVWCIQVVDFPAFIIVDDKGNDFFATWKM